MVEREIDLLDMLADILSHWRGLLVCMLVGAVLMGSCSFAKSVKGSVQTEVPVISGESAETAELPAASPSVSAKPVLVGAFLPAFAYAGAVSVLYVMNNKIRMADELQKLYNIPQLGLIVKEGKDSKEAKAEKESRAGKETKDSKKAKNGKVRKKCKELAFWIDRQVDMLRNRGKRRLNREQSLELAAAAINILLCKHEIDDVCLMGCDLKAGAGTVLQMLKEKLEEKKIAVTILDNVLYDAEMMEELKNVKGIVLVEKAMSSRYDEILHELELISRQEIMVLGGIIVE